MGWPPLKQEKELHTVQELDIWEHTHLHLIRELLGMSSLKEESSGNTERNEPLGRKVMLITGVTSTSLGEK
jgi:hypothetical protein